MRKWEDIVKEKLEAPDGSLSESVFDEFHTRFDGAESKHTAKRFPLVWTLFPVAAAGIAAVLLLRKPDIPEETLRQVQPSSVALLQVDDPSDVVLPMVTPHFFGQSTVTGKVSDEANSDIPEEPATTEDRTEAPEPTDTQEEASISNPGTNSSAGNASTTMTSPFISLTGKARKVNIRVAPAAGGILGTGILAALATNLASAKNNTVPSYIGHGTVVNPPTEPRPTDHEPGSGIWDSSPGSSATEPGVYPLDPPAPDDPVSKEVPVKDLLEHSSHYFPIKAGLSARLPLTEKLFLTTGLEYSFYRSRFAMSYSGEKWQRVHYLGIPVRLDWIMASHSLFDVYVGGGVQGDFCLDATLAGMSLEKDRPSLSLIGAGGIQVNATKRLGFYFEPELSWRIPDGNNTLVTYRSEHPVMFSVSAGIRINLGN